jgi:hypothetical protein
MEKRFGVTSAPPTTTDSPEPLTFCAVRRNPEASIREDVEAPRSSRSKEVVRPFAYRMATT